MLFRSVAIAIVIGGAVGYVAARPGLVERIWRTAVQVGGGLSGEVQRFVGVSPTANANCHPSYQGACLRKGVDYDCAGGRGQPPFAGRVRVVGPDVYRLDSDGDGIGCE